VAGHDVDDAYWWDHRYRVEDDPSGLFCEANTLRYRPLARIVIRLGPGADPAQVKRVESAAHRCGARTELSDAAREPDHVFAARLGSLGVERVRVIGDIGDEVRRAAHRAGVHLATDPVTPSGRIELLHFLREQAVSRTRHRFGNLVGAPPTPTGDRVNGLR
jgi:RHH-type proline utilization regulon transcriptional repressor/proline dehydrogenase/delta 1-pyrroline-5-carboxylate dehydrogenase